MNSAPAPNRDRGPPLRVRSFTNCAEKGALVLATTHLTDIIGFVHKTPGMVNAAMEFDRSTFTPLYD